MDKQVAKHIAASAIRCSSQIGQLLPFAKKFCTQEEYNQLRSAVASITAAIGTDIVDWALATHPEIKREMDKSVDTFGMVI